MALKAGSVDDFNGSMAEAMENAFQSLWAANKDVPLGEAGETDRQILFSAIAQGVVSYLSDNLNDALDIEVSVTQDSSNNITSANGSVSVTQNGGAGNRVSASGQATNLVLNTE